MTTYLYYPRLPDGAAPTFVARELDGDDVALAAAHDVLAEHASAVDVAVWQGERLVGTAQRKPDDLAGQAWRGEGERLRADAR